MPGIKYGDEQVSVGSDYINRFLDKISTLTVNNQDSSNGLSSQIGVFRSRKVLTAMFNNTLTRRALAETFKRISDELFAEINEQEKEQIEAEAKRAAAVDEFIKDMMLKIKEKKGPYHPDIAQYMREYGIDPDN